MPTNYTNTKESQSLKGQAVLVTCANNTDFWRLQKGQFATNQSSGKTGTVGSVDVYGISFQINPIQPNTTFESAGIYGYLAVGETITVLTGTQLPVPPPGPDTMSIVLDDEGSTITAGAILNFRAVSNRVSDSGLVVHIVVIGGSTDTFSMDMTNAQIGRYEWQTYYEPPFIDVEDTAQVYVTGFYHGVQYTSNTIQFDFN